MVIGSMIWTLTGLTTYWKIPKTSVLTESEGIHRCTVARRATCCQRSAYNYVQVEHEGRQLKHVAHSSASMLSHVIVCFVGMFYLPGSSGWIRLWTAGSSPVPGPPEPARLLSPARHWSYCNTGVCIRFTGVQTALSHNHLQLLSNQFTSHYG